MPITTKTGDDGKTTWRNARVPKDSKEIIFLGLMDRAMAEVAIARIHARAIGDAALDGDLKQIASALSDICAILAADVSRNLQAKLEWCTNQTRHVEFTNFIDFGETNALAASINLARTSVRLAESHLPEDCDEQDPNIRPLMNRLSDILFVLAVENRSC